MKYIAILITLSLPFLTSAQITLKKYDDPQKQGYQSIVFENTVGKNPDGTERKEKVEYNLVVNNPFNKENLPIQSTKQNGINVYHIIPEKISEIAKEFSISEKEIVSNSLISSNSQFNFSGDYAIIAYNKYIYYPSGDALSNGRKSVINIISNSGKTIQSTTVQSDAQSLAVSPNGKYYTYYFGSYIHGSEPKKNGFRVLSTATNKIILEVNNSFVLASFIKHGYLVVKASISEGTFKWLIDYKTGNIYQLAAEYYIEGYSKVKMANGTTTISDLSTFRIK